MIGHPSTRCTAGRTEQESKNSCRPTLLPAHLGSWGDAQQMRPPSVHRRAVRRPRGGRGQPQHVLRVHPVVLQGHQPVGRGGFPVLGEERLGDEFFEHPRGLRGGGLGEVCGGEGAKEESERKPWIAC